MDKRKIIIFLLIILSLRLASLGLYDVFDTTEARYSGVAFRMVEKNDFVTPWFLPDIPFLGKPPFAFWITAVSFKIFNSYHEFFARLPHFIVMLIVLWIGYLWTVRLVSKERALIFLVVFASTPGFLLLSGSVMLDASLLLGITLTNFGFFYGLNSKKIGYLFFIGLTISVLSKGLTGVVLSGIPCFLFTLLRNKWRDLINLPLLVGSILFLVLTMPWYLLMERANSGFLEYFFIGEHFKRYFVPGWSGDMYGHAHREPLFMIIPFFLLLVLQWFIYSLFMLIKYWREFLVTYKSKLPDDRLFLILTIIAPLLFLCFANNIIVPYASFGVMPFSILVALYLPLKEKPLAWLSIPISILTFAICVFVMPNTRNSHKEMIKIFNEEDKGGTLYYVQPSGYQFNAFFYARDKIKIISEEELSKMNNIFFLSEREHKAKKILCDKEKCLYKKQ